MNRTTEDADDTVGTVVELVRRRTRSDHEPASRHWIARRVARLLGASHGGEFDGAARATPPLYFVPDSTLMLDDAHALGIASAAHLLGGVVPRAFVASKAITHPLFDAATTVPAGWSTSLGPALTEVVLPGYSAFSRNDAARAGRALLDAGMAVRVKPGGGIGGAGQSIVADAASLDRALFALSGAELQQLGVVVELNLESIITWSVGEVAVGSLRIAYVGTQSEVRNHAGDRVYGGSKLDCVRGDLDCLQTTSLAATDAMRRVVACALAYDHEVQRAYPSMFASRRNYDVAVGIDAQGHEHAGVLEQSWRIGGATPAELLALEAFRADASLTRVQASTHEVYALVDPGPADVCYRGEDPRVGALTKFCRIDRYGRESGDD